MSIDDDYPTDMTDDQWELLVPLLPERTWRPGGPGRPPCDVRRECHRHPVPQQDGLPMASGAQGIWPLEHHLWLFQALATRRRLGG